MIIDKIKAQYWAYKNKYGRTPERIYMHPVELTGLERDAAPYLNLRPPMRLQEVMGMLIGIDADLEAGEYRLEPVSKIETIEEMADISIQLVIKIIPDGKGYYAFSNDLSGLYIDGSTELEAYTRAKDAAQRMIISLIKEHNARTRNGQGEVNKV